MNYGDLITAIQTYTENNFPSTTLADGTTVSSTTQLNRFIEQAEQRIYNSVQFPSLRKNVVGAVSATNKYLSCPDDYLATYSLAVIDSTGAYEYLLNKDVNFIRQAYPNPTTDTGIPRYYALFGPNVTNSVITNELSFIVGPTPDVAYNVELHYYYYPASIVQGAVTGVTISNAGNLLANGTYYNINLTNGSGNSAIATVVVSGNVVTSVTITAGGAYYVVGDTLTVPASSLGATSTSSTSGTVTVGSVSNSTGTSWLGDNFDTVLLYGSLVEAYTYMKGEQDLITLYDAKYKEALALAKRLGDGMERQDAYRSGQFRQAVT